MNKKDGAKALHRPYIEHAQTALMSATIEKLKIVTGQNNTKDALASAVYFTIENMKKEDSAEVPT